MKQSSRACRLVPLSLSVIILSATGLWAQHSAVPRSKQARAVPIDGSKITLKFTWNDGQVVSATQLNGGLIRIERSDEAYAFVPKLRDGNKGVDLWVYRLTPVYSAGEAVGEKMKLLESLELEDVVGGSVNSTVLPVTLHIERIKIEAKTGKSVG